MAHELYSAITLTLSNLFPVILLPTNSVYELIIDILSFNLLIVVWGVGGNVELLYTSIKQQFSFMNC